MPLSEKYLARWQRYVAMCKEDLAVLGGVDDLGEATWDAVMDAIAAELERLGKIEAAAREYVKAELAWWTYVNTDAGYLISGDLPLQKARDLARNAFVAAVGTTEEVKCDP